jgi:putative DNA primase/helicase
MVPPNPSTLPPDLLSLPWVAWRLVQREGKITKVPVDPETGRFASVTDSSTWSTFPTATEALTRWNCTGIGVVLSDRDDLTGIDLDNCRDPETGGLEDWARDFVLRLDSYTEVTPGRRGLRTWVRGKLQLGMRNRKKYCTGEIEMYSRERYFTVTGEHLEGTPLVINERTSQLFELHQSLFGIEQETESVDHGPEPRPLTLADVELLKRAEASRNGAKFRRLWAGDASEYSADESRADLALCCALAFWTGKDAGRIDRLFRQSGLMRPKWEREDYRNRTISAAIDKTSETWRGPARNKSARVAETTASDLPMEVPPTTPNSMATASVNRNQADRLNEEPQPDGQLNQTEGSSSSGALSGEEVEDFSLEDDGLYFVRTDLQNGRVFKKREWISPPIRVEGRACTFEDTGYGLVVVFSDCRQKERQHILSRKLLYGDGADALNELIDRGFEPSREKRAITALKKYLCCSNPKNWIRHVSRVGWHGGVFVFPDRTIGIRDDREKVVFHTEEPIDHRYGTAGSLQDWQTGVSKLCRGNSRLLFAVSCAFAAPLLKLVRIGNGGFHYRGLSTVGKTTALIAAGSVFGGRTDVDFTQTWRATANGLESQAALHNDCLLPLDEIGQVLPKEISEAVYFLGNGQGKQRSTKTGGARTINSFRVLLLSTGERSIGEVIESAGTIARGGHTVRLAEVPADAGRSLGIFDTLHEYPGGAELSAAIAAGAKSFYGTPIRAFLGHVVTQTDTIIRSLNEARHHFVKENLPRASSPEVERILNLFGHVAAAGELATELTVTGWTPGDATWAAKACFDAHLKQREGLGPRDLERGIGALRRFIQTYGSSRFQRLGAKDRDNRGQQFSGWIGTERVDSKDVTVYFIPGETFANEILKEFDAEEVARELLRRGLLLVNEGGSRLQYQKRLPLPGVSATKPMRTYAVLSSLLGEGEERAE